MLLFLLFFFVFEADRLTHLTGHCRSLSINHAVFPLDSLMCCNPTVFYGEQLYQFLYAVMILYHILC